MASYRIMLAYHHVSNYGLVLIIAGEGSQAMPNPLEELVDQAIKDRFDKYEAALEETARLTDTEATADVPGLLD